MITSDEFGAEVANARDGEAVVAVEAENDTVAVGGDRSQGILSTAQTADEIYEQRDRSEGQNGDAAEIEPSSQDRSRVVGEEGEEAGENDSPQAHRQQVGAVCAICGKPHEGNGAVGFVDAKLARGERYFVGERGGRRRHPSSIILRHEIAAASIPRRGT